MLFVALKGIIKDVSRKVYTSNYSNVSNKTTHIRRDLMFSVPNILLCTTSDDDNWMILEQWLINNIIRKTFRAQVLYY